MHLYLIRHGQSQHNADGRIQGQCDVGLSRLGHVQSRALADELADAPIEAIVASPLQRAMQTARPLAERMGLPISTDDRLKEIHAGIFQGMLRDELAERYPDEYRRWIGGDPDFAIPEGESRRALMQRSGEAIQAIREAGHRNVAVVAHGGSLSGALKVLLDIPAHRHPFKLMNAAISRVRWEPSSTKLLTLNETHHLAGIDGVGGGDL